MHDDMHSLDTNLPPLPQENIDDREDHDNEGAMAKADLFKLANYSVKLFKKIEDDDQLESWVQAKIVKAADYIASVYHFLEYEMKFSEFGSKLENSEMYSESEKKELKNKLMEAKEKIKDLKKLQADKLEGKKTVKVKESWDDEDEDEDPDVKKATHELNKKGIKLPKIKDKEVPIKKTTKDKEEELDETSDATKNSYRSKAGKDMQKSAKDGDKDAISKRLKGVSSSLKDKKVVEAVKKAKKDYDGDGKIESEKDEVWGSRMKAANKSKKVSETAKPDFLDLDKDGNKKEPMKKASKEKKVSETAPSAGLSKEKKSATVKKAKAGGDIGKKGKGFEKVEKAAKAGGAKDPKAVAAAAMWKNIKRESLREGIKLNESHEEAWQLAIQNVPQEKIHQLADALASGEMTLQDFNQAIQDAAYTDYSMRRGEMGLDKMDHDEDRAWSQEKGEWDDWDDWDDRENDYDDDMDETSDEENDVISAPQPAPQPEPNPEENDVISAPMNESLELGRIKMLSGL